MIYLVSPSRSSSFITLAFWKPTILAVSTVGYLSWEEKFFITLFNACTLVVPLVIQHRLGIPSLSAARTKIMQNIHNEQSMKSKAFDLLSGLLNFSRKRCVEIHSILTFDWRQ